MNSNTTWFVSTNSNLCRIYQFDKKEKTLTLIKELIHPESKLKTGELTAGKPGHYKTSTSTRGTYSAREDAKEIEIDNFSREVARELAAGKNTNQYHHLIIASHPRMNGLIHKHLDKQVKDCIDLDINKDYTHLKEKEILETLLKQIRPKF